MHFYFISDGAGSGSWGQSKTRKWYRLVLAELQPRTSSRQQDFRDIGPSWSQTVSETRCGQAGSSRPSPAQRPFQGSLRTTSKEPRRCSRPVTPAVHVPPKDTPRCDTATRLGTGCCCTCGWLFWGRGRTSVLTASFPRVRPQRPPKGLMVVDVVVAVTAVIAVELSPVDGNSYPRAWKAERVGSWRRPRPFPTETQHTLTRSSPAKAKERWLRRSNAPRSKTRSCRTTQRARADTSAASVAACTPPACLQEGGGGVPVTPAAPGALADWIDWLQFPLGRSWDFFCPLSPFARSSPSLLDQATLPALHHLLLSLFCFTSPHSLLSIFPSRLPLKERDLNRQPLPLPNAHHHNTTLDRSRRVFPPRSSSEAAKASITPSLATDDQGKLFFVLYSGICG